MHYAHATGIKVENFDSFRDVYIVAQPTDQQAERVCLLGHSRSPAVGTQRANQAAVRENCQKWSTRIIAPTGGGRDCREEMAIFAESIQEPIIH